MVCQRRLERDTKMRSAPLAVSEAEVLLIIDKHLSLIVGGGVVLGLLDIISHFRHDLVEVSRSYHHVHAILKRVCLEVRHSLGIYLRRSDAQVKDCPILILEQPCVQGRNLLALTELIDERSVCGRAVA